MKVSKISIRNVMGVESLDITPGSVTVISGANGTGKTSVLEALKSVVDGGSDATLIRKGQTAGEVVWLLDDGRTIRKRIAQAKSAPTVKDASGKDLAKPQSIIDGLLDGISANPIRFLTAPPAERAKWLLDVMPCSVSQQDLEECGADRWLDDEIDLTIEGIDLLRKRIYDDRTGLNRIVKERTAAAAALNAQAPEGSAEETAAALADVEAGLQRIHADIGAEESKLAAAIAHRKAELVDEYRAGIDGIRADYGKRIADLEQALRELKAEQAQREAELQRIGSDAAKESAEELTAASAETITRLTTEAGQLAARRATLAERANAHTRAIETRRIIAINEEQAAVAQAQAAEASACLDALDALKKRLLENLPIPGVEVRDGDIYAGGIPFDRLNTAKKVAIALKVARLRAGECGLVLVDNLECLDAKTFEAFESAAVKSGLQFIVTRVSDGPLKVEVVA